VTAADSAPINIGRTGRSLLGLSCVGAAILISVLFVALQPSSPTPDAQDVIALTNSELRIASLDYPSVVTFGIDADIPNPMSPDPKPVSPGPNDAVGIMLPNDQFLITTIAAIADLDAIDVQLASGRTVTARVVQTYPDLSVAVLSVSEQEPSTAIPDLDVMSIIPRGAKFAKGQVVMALVDIPRQLTVSDRIGKGLFSLRSSTMTASEISFVSEGTPIVDKSGQLVGLCTHIDGVLSFIPFITIEEALASWIRDAGGDERKKSR